MKIFFYSVILYSVQYKEAFRDDDYIVHVNSESTSSC